MRATIEWPSAYGAVLKSAFDDLARRFVRAREERLAGFPGAGIERHPHQLPLGAHGHLPLLRRSGAAVAELAARPGRDRRSAAARLRRRSGNPRPHLHVRDRRLGQRAVSRHGGPRRRALSVWRLRPGNRRRRDQGAGPGRTDGRAALRGRLQAASAGEDSEVGQARPGQVGPRLPRATTRGRQRRRHPHEARREAVGVGGARHRAERELPDGQQDDAAASIRHAALARPVLAAPAPVPRHQRGGVPGDAGRGPRGGPTGRRSAGGLRVPGARAGHDVELQQSIRPLGQYDWSGTVHLRPT